MALIGTKITSFLFATSEQSNADEFSIKLPLGHGLHPRLRLLESVLPPFLERKNFGMPYLEPEIHCLHSGSLFTSKLCIFDARLPNDVLIRFRMKINYFLWVAVRMF